MIPGAGSDPYHRGATGPADSAREAALPAVRIGRLVRDVCRADVRVRAALTYGSVPQGLADEFSDAEFWIFLATDADVVPEQWVASVGKPLFLRRNEFGAHVAIYPGLVRAEFHFVSETDVGDVRGWPARGAPVADMVVVDRGTGLTAALESLPLLAPVPGDPIAAEAVADICGRLVNWWVLGVNVLTRGEHERAADALSHVRRQLLWLLRLRAGTTTHWLTPSRRAELDLPAADIAALRELDDPELGAAYAAAWRMGSAAWAALDPPGPPHALATEIAASAVLRAGAPSTP